MKRHIEPIIHLFAIFGIYLLLTGGYLFDDAVMFGPDNMKYSFPFFTYFAESLKQGFGTPLWDPSDGGTPIGITGFFLLPYSLHKIIGYLIYLLAPASLIASFKLSLVAGLMIISAGLWLFLNRLTSSVVSATVGTALFIIGGCGMTVFHQEQVILTAISTPWVAYFALKVQDDRRFIVPLAVVAGFALTTHYPHIHLLFFIFAAISLFASKAIGFETIKSFIPGKKKAVVAIAVFVLSILPLFYVAGRMGDFRSPVRQSASTGAESFDEYMKMNRIQNSSATGSFFLNYISPKAAEADIFLCFATYSALFLMISALLLDRKKALPFLLLLILLSWAALGVNGYLAQALYLMRFPMIGQFRQWYHFLHLVNIMIASLSAIGFGALLKKLHEKGFRHWTTAALAGVIFLIPAFLESSSYFESYKAAILKRPAMRPSALSRTSFLSYLNQGYFNRTLLNNHYFIDTPPPPAGVSKLTVYKNVYDFRQDCKNKIPLWPFVTTAVLDDTQLNPLDRAEALKNFCISGLDGKMALVTIGKGYSSTEVATLPSSAVNAVAMAPNSFYSEVPQANFSVSPSGADLELIFDRSAVVIFPFAHKLGLQAVVNNHPTETLSAFNGAMTALPIQPGKSIVQLKAPITFYEIAIIIQAFVLVLALLFALFPNLVKDG